MNYEWLQLRRPQCLYCLVVGTENADTARVHNTTDTLRRCSVQVALVFSMLDEFARLNVLLHFLTGDEKVFPSRDFTWSNVAGGVCRKEQLI